MVSHEDDRARSLSNAMSGQLESEVTETQSESKIKDKATAVDSRRWKRLFVLFFSLKYHPQANAVASSQSAMFYLLSALHLETF